MGSLSTIRSLRVQKIKSLQKAFIAVIFFCLLSSIMGQAQAQTVRYVKEGGTGDGSSWANASGDLQAMLNQSVVNDEVWVAGGTYKPVRPLNDLWGSNDPTNKDNSFYIRSSVKVYGGFAGDESSLSERDLSSDENRSILSGDIDGDGVTNDDNSYHVVVLSSGILDGFTIIGGYSYTLGSTPTEVSASTLEVSKARGGGVVVRNSNRSELSNLIIQNNYAYYSGGGVYIEDSSDDLPPTLLTNVVIAGNEVGRYGGAIGVENSDVILTNGSLSGNKSGENIAIYVYGIALMTVRNSIVFGNQGAIDAPGIYTDSEVNYSLIEGSSSTSNGNIASTDPKFVSAPAANTAPFSGGDYRLFNGSPALDVGNNTVFNSGQDPDLSHIDTDIAGNDRIQNGTVDLGAFEGGLPEPFVTNNNNSGPGSLRYVIENTFDGSTITFDESLNGDEITLTTGQITIEKSFTIAASSLSDGITISGNNESRVFEIESGQEVTLKSLSVTEGRDGSAAGIRNTGDLTLENVTVYGNTATSSFGSGGGILNNGFSSKLTVRNSTISGNSTASGDTYGGGIYNNGGDVILENSTLFNNSAAVSGGGIYQSGGTLVIKNSGIAGSEGGDCVASGGLTEEYSFIEDGSCSATLSGDPKLGELSDNGGPTFTHLPQSDSPLLDAGSCNSLSTDQRGMSRPVDLDYITDANDGCDIGSVEARTDEVSPLPSPDENNILYVDQNVGGGNETGDSWSNAIPELRDALTWAQDWDGDAEGTLQIWVAEGLYLPTDDDIDRFATFQLVDGVQLYGGFAGDENDLSDRDWNENITILSGDIAGDDDTTEKGLVLNFEDINGGNSHHVVTGSGTDNSAVLNGFTITAGRSAGGARDENGSGMYNLGGSPALTNLTIIGNWARGSGGGIFNDSSSEPLLTNVIFISNNAFNGGGMYNEVSSPVLVNVSFTANKAENFGGGMVNFSEFSNPILTNVIMWDNEEDGSSSTVSASIFNVSDADPQISHSLIANSGGSDSWNSDMGTDGGNNIDADPQFTDPGNGDYTLQNTSPAINAGDPDTDPGLFPGGPDNPLDLAGNPRLDAVIIDMGAYEFQGASAPITPNENILYVDQNVSGGNGSGNSWPNAIPQLRDALAWAKDWNGETDGTLQIWVAEGIYLPTDDADREASFQMINHVEIYGGFAGDEDPDFDLDDRDFEANETILSGDLEGDGPPGNVYHVFHHDGSNLDNTAVLDGVTIFQGRATGSFPYYKGAGMHNVNSDPLLRNVIFEDNRASYLPGDSNLGFGGGLFNDGSSPILINVTFFDNYADRAGAIGNITGSNPVLTNVKIIGNSALEGAGMINGSNSDPILTNVLITGNSASRYGGGIYNTGSDPILTNVTISSNVNGGLYNSGSSEPVLRNSIVWGNSGSQVVNSGSGSILTMMNSIVPGYDDPDNGNIDKDPLFVNPSVEDYRLLNSSPAINAGSNQAYTNAGGDLVNDKDLAGNPRVFDGETDIIDIGAYEFQGEPFSISPDGDNILYVDQDAEGDGSGSSWNNAIPELRDGLAWAQDWDGGTLQIWVAEGVYLPTGDGSTRTATFQLVNDVELYGGFDPDGGADEFGERDWNENLTILSGDIDGNDDEEIITDPENQITGGNSHHVVNSSYTDDSAVLDGFTITAGLTEGTSFPADRGAGLFNDEGTPVLTHLAITGNSASYGGGMYIGGSSPTLTNVLFTANHAENTGGGLYIGDNSTGDNSAPVLTAAIFSDNSAGSGGGMYNSGSDPVLIGGLFEGNSASNGGGMYNLESSPILTNVTLTGNTAVGNGGGMFNMGNLEGEESTPALTNVIIWGNEADDNGNEIYKGDFSDVTLDYSLYRNRTGEDDIVGIGTFITINSLSVDPLFSDPGNGDYTLQNISPAINAGDPATNLSLFTGGPDDPVDLAGNPRFFDGGTVDMGAYEFQGEPVTIPEAVVLSTPSDEAANVGLTPEFGWQPLDGADTYKLQVSENEEFSSTVIDESGLTETTFEPASDLGYSTTYYWRARASNEAGDGEWSELFSFTTLPESSEVVILTDPSDEQDGVPLKPLFEWNTADGAETYELIVSSNFDLSDPVIEENGISETEFQTADNLNFSTMYYWQVRGVNAGGPGEWSEMFSFTTLDQPEAADNRLLLANTGSYTFTPADFGMTDNSFTVVIDDVPGGFSGDFELEGNPVSSGNELSVGDIDDGKLTYTPPAGEYGYGYDSFEFSIEDTGGNPSEVSYTMSLDVAATSVELTGGEGWRFVGNPSDGDSYDDLLGPIWTKGMAGSDNPGATFSNVYLLNQQEYQWEYPADLGNATDPGRPFILYVYSDDDNDGTPEGFPKTLTSGEHWDPLDGSFFYNELGYDESPSNNPDNFYLVANPHPVSLDFCEFAGTNIATSATFWNPDANGGNGDYEALNCETLEELAVAPFQAFWIRTTDTSPALEIPDEAYLGTTADGYFKEPQVKEDLFRIVLTVGSEENEQVFSNRTELYFSEEAKSGTDPMDALKLSPAGLANRWLSFHSLDGQGKAYAFQSLPTGFEEKLRIPMDIQTTESGRFTLDWSLPESHVFGGSYYLKDNQSGEVIELREGTSYNFEITPGQAVQIKQTETTPPMSDIAENGAIAVDTHRMSKKAAPRFELLVAAAGVDGLSELGAVPEAFELAQNYPNPFNPTTVIRYQLAASSQVRLTVYDMLGRQVATLVDGQVSAGRHTINFDAGNLSSGIYLYRLQAGSQIMTRKLTVVK